VPLHEVRARVTEILQWAQGRGPVWIYCGSGFRASIGASMLEAQGLDVVHVDDDFGNAAPAGLPIVVPGHEDRLGGAYAD
jgi:rhodanese-related sulfurtransferase